MVIFTKAPGWQYIVLNDAFKLYIHNGQTVAVELRGHTFRAQVLEYKDRSMLFDLLGQERYEQAHQKPGSWFDDLIEHICPPLPLELDPEWQPVRMTAGAI